MDALCVGHVVVAHDIRLGRDVRDHAASAFELVELVADGFVHHLETELRFIVLAKLL